MGVVLQIERHAPPVVERYCHARRADALDATERPVLHTQVTFILEEHDAVAFRKSALAALDIERDLIAERLARFQPLTHRLVELTDLVIGVGQDDPARIRIGLPVTIPRIDKLRASSFACVGAVDEASIRIVPDRLAGPPGGKLARRVTLPVLLLAAELHDPDGSMTLGGGTERGPRPDRSEERR